MVFKRVIFKFNKTVLYFAIEYDNLEMIKLLLSDERVDPNVLNIIN